mmetsp:Transcript_169469/g.538066  ORF Transcript_169469/g.538066 Transcript_169469/m.538066 type:complete len:82 (+) Transcript_169469:776-1021(+)
MDDLLMAAFTTDREPCPATEEAEPRDALAAAGGSYVASTSHFSSGPSLRLSIRSEELLGDIARALDGVEDAEQALSRAGQA